jgi:hypothetical protein
MSNTQTPATPLVAPVVPTTVTLDTTAPAVAPTEPVVKPTEPKTEAPAADAKAEVKPVEQPATEPKPAPALAPEELTKFQEEFATGGDLSPESYKALADKGYPEDAVKRYVEGQRAVGELITAQVELGFGGDLNTFNEYKTWAANNLTPEQRTEFNNSIAQAVTSGDIKQVRKIASDAYAQYRDQVGTVGQLAGGRSAPAGVKPFSSMQEQVEAQMSPRYRNDTAYRNEVMARVAVSKY